MLNRILLIGCCGAGKTTLAYTLADIMALPIIHLDKEYFYPEWVEPDEAEWVQKVTALAARDTWIMDGNYSGSLDIRLERADMVIFLDYGRVRCLARALKRTISTYHCVRQDMASGCPERFNWAFLAYIWSFHKTIMPRIRSAFTRHPDVPVIRLRNPLQTAAYVKSLLVKK